MPNKKLIIALFLAALLVISGCSRRNEFLDMLEPTPMPQNVADESEEPSQNQGLSNDNTYDTSNSYVPLAEQANPPAEDVDYGVSYTDTSSGARNTGGSGSSASYSDVPSRNTGSSSSSSSSGDDGSTDDGSTDDGSTDDDSTDDTATPEPQLPYYYPNIIGLTEDEAIDKLDYCDLEYDYIEYEVSYASEGTVLYQSFPADLEGDLTQPYEIGLVVSAGNVPYPVPRSGGVWMSTFTDSLPRDAQPDVVIIFEYSLTRLGDQGIYTLPGEGQMNTLGNPVTFYVSKGMLVGDYVGFEFVLIYPELSQGVAYFRNFIGEYSETVPDGVVISQNHEPGTVLTTQSTADALIIKYSLGPDSSGYTATPVPQEGDGDIPVD